MATGPDSLPQAITAALPDRQFDLLLGELQALRAAHAEPRAVMTTEEAAAYLSMSTQNLELLRLNGDGPRYAKLGRLVRYRRESMDAWVLANERGNTSEPAR